MAVDKMCKVIVEIEMVLDGESTVTQAEDMVVDWMDRMMLYSIGHNEVIDHKCPRVFDYDIRRVNE